MKKDRHTAMEIFVRAVDFGSFSSIAMQPRFDQSAALKATARLEYRTSIHLAREEARAISLLLWQSGHYRVGAKHPSVDEARYKSDKIDIVGSIDMTQVYVNPPISSIECEDMPAPDIMLRQPC